MKNFNKLDVAAKVFPSVTNKNNSSVFRLSVVLKEEIDEHVLQLAVNMIYQRYKLFFLRLRRGVFWDYFDKNYFQFTVDKETETPCNSIISFENKGYIMKVLYYKNRISVEAFHSITDGSGISEFVKSLVYYYICIKYGQIDSQGKVLLFDEKDTNDLDSFTEHFTDVKENKKITASNRTQTLRITGEKFPKGGHCLVTGTISVKATKSFCKENNCTITSLLIANLIWAIYEEKQKNTQNNKTIVITVPVNLRKIFDSSTLKNFFTVVRVSYKMNETSTFEDLLNEVSKQLKISTKQDYLKYTAKQTVKITNNIFSKHTPLILKNIIIPIGFQYMGELKRTMPLSNIGPLVFPDEAIPFIEQVEVFSYPTKKAPLGCAVCSFDDKLSINFIRSIKDASVIKGFFTSLASKIGSDVSVYSNMWGDDYE